MTLCDRFDCTNTPCPAHKTKRPEVEGWHWWDAPVSWDDLSETAICAGYKEE